MILDTHLHLDPTIDGTALGAATELDLQLRNAGIARGIVLHLETQPWSAVEFSKAISKFPRLRGFINVHPDSRNAIESMTYGVKELGFIGLKLHPRLQEFDLASPTTAKLAKEAGALNIPVLIDAFPDGTHIMQGFSPMKYATLALECPSTKFIWAHMGGHYVLDFLMLAKRLPNIYMDLSYSLLYYQNSSIIGDIIYAMRSMKFERIFYGSDYPDRSIEVSLKLSLTLLNQHGLTVSEVNKICFTNAITFFEWTDLQKLT